MSNAIHTQYVEFDQWVTAVEKGVKIRKIEKRTTRVTVYVDLAQIARDVGARAATNKSGRARYMKGAVIIDAE